MHSSPSFRSIVATFEGKLSEADRALISIILNDPGRAVYLSSTALAADAEVHASTVVRLARKLGFDGYPGMLSQLRNDAENVASISSKSQRRLNQIEQGSNLSNLINSEISALDAIGKTLTQHDIDQATDLLAEARTIYIVGRGSAAPLAVHFDRRLRRSGFSTDVAMNLSQRDLAEHLLGFRKDDAVVVFAFQAPASLPTGYTTLLKHAKQLGAHSIVIADASATTMRPRPDIMLSVSRPDEGEMQLRTGPMLVCEALAMTLAYKNPEPAVAGFESLEVLRSKFLSDKK